MTTTQIDNEVSEFTERFQLVKEEISKVIVGNDEIIDGTLISLLSKGHVLLEGIPGIGKTKIVATVADVLHLTFSRIQFTPDLMPGDIVGSDVVHESDTGEKHLDFQKGPIFTHILLADEINRATPKTQSALLEAMQERSVTVGTTTHQLQPPFFVLATQNPLEMEGTYPLPEAQLDRFFYKLKITYPEPHHMHEIMDRTTRREEPEAGMVLDRDQILVMRDTARSVPSRSGLRDPPDARDPSGYAPREPHDEAVRTFWRQPSGNADLSDRGQGQCAAQRSRPCVLRRHSCLHASRAAPPRAAQLRRRGRAD